MRIYEGMFVLDDTRANENWDGVAAEVRALLERREAQILSLERWDERRLAYRIRGHSRGVYLLARFTAPREALGALERDCQLNDTILRVLFTRDTQSEKLHKAVPADTGGGEGEQAPPHEGEAAEDQGQAPGPEEPSGSEQAAAQEPQGQGAAPESPESERPSTHS